MSSPPIMLPLRIAQGRGRLLQEEVCFSRWSARKLPFRFRPDYVTPARHRAQDRTFGSAPIVLKNSDAAPQDNPRRRSGGYLSLVGDAAPESRRFLNDTIVEAPPVGPIRTAASIRFRVFQHNPPVAAVRLNLAASPRADAAAETSGSGSNHARTSRSADRRSVLGRRRFDRLHGSTSQRRPPLLKQYHATVAGKADRGFSGSVTEISASAYLRKPNRPLRLAGYRH